MPTLHPEEFPLLNPTNKQPNYDNTLQTNFFKCFLVMKNKKPNDLTLANLDPWVVDDYVKAQVGRNSLYKIKTMRSGSLLIEVDSIQSKTKLLKCGKMSGIEIVVEEHNSLNTSKGVIHLRSLSKKTNGEIKDMMNKRHDYNVKEVHRIMRKDRQKNTEEPTHTYIVTFGSPSLPVPPGHKIKIGYDPVELEPYIPNPRRCFKCQRYRHGQNTCRLEQVCPKCGTKGHDYASCPNDPHCLYCGQKHACTYTKCPMFILEKKIVEENARNHLPFPEAEQKVYFNNPDLVAQCPGIKVERQNNITYSSVTSSSNSRQHFQTLQAQFDSYTKSQEERFKSLATDLKQKYEATIKLQEEKFQAIIKNQQDMFAQFSKSQEEKMIVLSNQLKESSRELKEASLRLNEVYSKISHNISHPISPVNPNPSQALFSQTHERTMEYTEASAKRKASTDDEEYERALRQRRHSSSSLQSSFAVSGDEGSCPSDEEVAGSQGVDDATEGIPPVDEQVTVIPETQSNSSRTNSPARHRSRSPHGKAEQTGAATLAAENAIPAAEDSMDPLNLSPSLADLPSTEDATRRDGSGPAPASADGREEEEEASALDLSVKNKSPKSPIITGLVNFVRKKPKK